MKKLIYFLLIVAAFSCKREKQLGQLPLRTDPLLVGNWQLLAHERTLSDGTKEWRTIDSPSEESGLIVRSDGALLSGNGKSHCCISFEKYAVNGKVYFPKPDAPVPYNERCLTIFCGICEDHQFQVEGDEMIWTRCGSRSRYRRLP